MKSDSLVIIPTYNEKENIRNIINAVLAIAEHQFDVLIVDDNSPDGTGAIVDEMITERPERIHILASRAWERPISPASSGRWSTTTVTSSRWMPTSRIPLASCPSCRRLVLPVVRT